MLPRSVSTSAHPARESVLAIRSGGKCGSMGRYTPPALKIASTAAIQSRFRSVTTATTPSERQPARQQSPAKPVGARVELAVSPLPFAVNGSDSVRVCLHALLEQLMEPAVRQLPATTTELFELEAEFSSGQEALPIVLGIRIGGDQSERSDVITGDPGRALRVEHVCSVPHHELVAVRCDPGPQHGPVRERAATVASRVEYGLERRLGEAQFAPEITDRKVPVRPQPRLGVPRVLYE